MPLDFSMATTFALCISLVGFGMASHPDTGLPTDGRGGRLWNSNITFPVYPSPIYPDEVNRNISWSELDHIFNENEQVDATAGICFGICLLALLNMIALTPKAKRRLPLFVFNSLALATLAARYLTLIVTYTALEVGSAYYNIAANFAGTQTIQSVIGIVFEIWLPPFALIFVVLCFYVQGKCVLVLLAMKRRYLYLCVISYLIGLSICTIILRVVYAIYITVNYFNAGFYVPIWMITAVLALYTATILSWSLIFSWQVGLCIFNRCNIGAAVDRHEAMAILFMTGVESMLIPMIFTVLQFCNISWFLLPEYLIMPSVACIIPFGSIWAGAAATNTNLARATQLVNTPIRCSTCLETKSHGNANFAMSGNTTVVNYSVPSLRGGNRFKINPNKKFVECNNILLPFSALPYCPDKHSLANSASSGAILPTMVTNGDLFGSASASNANISTGSLILSNADVAHDKVRSTEALQHEYFGGDSNKKILARN